ncbi:MAG TPA: SET domain-containing protein-lysine N-methyltransferase [Candidatus Babeliales bacterium]|nr:SET domain-containing protein-lysine N-methyltransferase [Candidatus Babeliales bacterium]
MSGCSTEFSFVLKPSPIGGVGFFATHDIPSGTILFRQENHPVRRLKVCDIPQELLKYCIYINDQECIAPERFDRMEIGWYLNHSFDPNVAHQASIEWNDESHVNTLYAIKDIKAGDEILMNYNDLDEPEDLKEEFYK